MQLFSGVSPATWTFGSPQTTQQRKGVPILTTNNSHPEVKLCENGKPLRCPFHPSAYDKDDSKTRLSCVLVLDDPQVAWVNEVEAWLIAAVQERSEEFLGWTPAETLERFRSSVKVNDKFGTTQLSLKLNTTGRFRCRFWDENMKEQDAMPPMEETHVVPIVKIRGIWGQPGTKMWGASWDMTHCLSQRCVQICPFADAEMFAEENTCP